MEPNSTAERQTEQPDNNEPVSNPGSVLYGVEDVPSPPMCFLFGLQVWTLCV